MGSSANLSQVVFKLSSGDVAGEINLKPEAWRVLTQVNGARTVTDVAKSVGMDEVTVTQIIDMLYKAGILEVAAGSAPIPAETVDASFFKSVSTELARAMGPLAQIIIEDEVANLNEKMDDFPRERIPDLVERVSAAIPDPKKRLHFQQIMLDNIRKI
jgi:hypothetical protein